MSNSRVVLLTYDGEFGRIAANFLHDHFDDLTVILESPVSRASLLRRRLQRLGFIRVSGQVLFMIFKHFQLAMSRRRIAEIASAFHLRTDRLTGRNIARLSSVNSIECATLLRKLNPRAVLVVGTRLISCEILTSIGAPFINYHAGITPKYRGVHGGYWALAQGDPENFGVTIHFVDEGIDTGSVIYQAKVQTDVTDNFSTYPYLQIAVALPLLEMAARDAIAGRVRARAVDLPSFIWSHPTLWSYLATGLRQQIW
jgi:folate-dependent phosphoribosylglycinamide formyltransferase PurN